MIDVPLIPVVAVGIVRLDARQAHSAVGAVRTLPMIESRRHNYAFLRPTENRGSDAVHSAGRLLDLRTGAVEPTVGGAVALNFGYQMDPQDVESAKNRSETWILDAAGFEVRNPLLIGVNLRSQLSLRQTLRFSEIAQDLTDIADALQTHGRTLAAS
jgi:hypothetical protein